MSLHLQTRDKVIWTGVGLGILVVVPAAIAASLALEKIEKKKLWAKHLVAGCNGPFEDVSDDTHLPYIDSQGIEYRLARCCCGASSWVPQGAINGCPA